MSSSGLVPAPFSNRVANEYCVLFSTPLAVETVPFPSFKPPVQTALPFRCIASSIENEIGCVRTKKPAASADHCNCSRRNVPEATVAVLRVAQAFTFRLRLLHFVGEVRSMCRSVICLMILFSMAASAAAPKVESPDYKQDYAKWRKAVDDSRRRNWLTLVGLF